MSFITLTTDFGIKDHFIGAVKGAIYTVLADAKIVDITHHISPFNITKTLTKVFQKALFILLG